MVNATEMNKALRTVYERAWPALGTLLERRKNLSKPFFISVPEGYPTRTPKVLIVGQQTNGWGDGPKEFSPADPVGSLMATYEKVFLHGPHSGAYTQGSIELYKALDPGGPDRGCVWSNLVKVGEGNARPTDREVEDSVARLALLEAELRILKPDIAVFFTGPDYDARLRTTFPDVRFVPRDD